jgi:hypothetical protein
MQMIPALMGLAAMSASRKAASQAAIAHKQSGEDEARAYREQAESAENAAQDREIIRLQKIRKTISTQRAYWAAAGIDPSTGSPTTISDRSYETFELDQGADLINTRQQIRSFNNSADAAIRMGNIKAKHSILSNRASSLSAMSSWIQ